jgi:hypothetical protein
MPILSHRERADIWAQLESYITRFPGDALILYDDSEVGWRITQVTEQVFRRPAYVLQDTEIIHSDSAVTDRLIRSALDQGRQVFFVMFDAELTWRPDQWWLEPADAFTFDTPVLKYPQGRPPRTDDLTRHIFMADIYRVLPLSAAKARDAAVRVPTGAGSYPYLLEGFYLPETNAAGDGYRWTNGHGTIVLPWPASDPEEPADLCLGLELSGRRPAPQLPAEITVAVEGVPLYRGQLDPDQLHTTLHIGGQSIHNEGSPKLEIVLESDTWDPSAVSQGRDQRELGIVFYGLELLPSSACAPQN